MDRRGLLTELIDLVSAVRPYVLCTGLPDAKDRAGGVISISFLINSLLLFFFDSFVCGLSVTGNRLVHAGS